MNKKAEVFGMSAPKSFCAIDASTLSLAFAFFTNGELGRYGKINFSGNTIYEKISDTAHKTAGLFKSVPVDCIVIEKTIFANSPQVAANLSLSQGALIAGAAMSGVTKIYGVAPMSWQSYVGTRLLTIDERQKIINENPNKSKSWYKAQEREQRKQKTISTVNERFGISIGDNDIADACGIGMFALNNWQKVVAK